MTGFELQTSGVVSDRSTNWATTIAQHDSSVRTKGHIFLLQHHRCRAAGKASCYRFQRGWPMSTHSKLHRPLYPSGGDRHSEKCHSRLGLFSPIEGIVSASPGKNLLLQEGPFKISILQSSLPPKWLLLGSPMLVDPQLSLQHEAGLQYLGSNRVKGKV